MSEIITRYGKARQDGQISISVVVPLFKVEQYIGELLSSFSHQKPGKYSIEYIFVDDGSPDSSSTLVHDWFRNESHYGKIIEKPNGGVSSARNRGLAEADSEWVIFPDSDDFLSPEFFAEAAKFLARPALSDVNVVANNLWRYMDATQSEQDTHALRFRFSGKSKIVNLENSPHYIHLHAASTFFRTSFLEDQAISFDSRIHASEDALFVAEALRASATPRIGINVGSRYYYRKRITGDSAVDTFKSKPETYFDRFELGYLELISRLQESQQQVPEWLQMLLLYEYRWIFGYELKVQTKESVLGPTGRQKFLSLVRRVLQFVTIESILGYRVTSMSYEIRLLLIALKEGAIEKQPVYVASLDKERNVMTLKYYFTGQVPKESIRVRAKEVTPVAQKTRKLDYFDQNILFERVLVVPSNSWLAVDLDGVRAELVLDSPKQPDFALTEHKVDSAYSRFDRAANEQRRAYVNTQSSLREQISELKQRARVESELARELPNLDKQRLRDLDSTGVAVLRKLAWSPENTDRFGDAWVFMDRLSQAQDNAEHLYRWMIGNHPEVKSFYVIKKESNDWKRLEEEGFNLVDFGSLEHYFLMLNAQVQLSSHADYEMFSPIPEKFYVNGVRSWRYVFLQHGVIKDDLSAWLNSKRFDLFVTTTEPEHNSICGDNTPYVFTSDCVVRTGLARYDSLARKSAELTKKSILIVPTWRESLMKPKVSFVGSRDFIDDLEDTSFFLSWQSLLSSSELSKFATDNSLEVVLLPHPIMAELINRFEIPSHIRIASYAMGDVQDLFASAHLTITDYSSVAFDVRFAGSNVVYFQFDRSSLHGSGHTMREGYYSYEADGFGPIFENAPALISALQSQGQALFAPYAERFDRLEIPKDQGACERTYNAIVELFSPIPKV